MLKRQVVVEGTILCTSIIFRFAGRAIKLLFCKILSATQNRKTSYFDAKTQVSSINTIL